MSVFLIVLVIEILIALFVRDNFVRPYLGDILVVVLIYCFVRAFVKMETKLLLMCIFLFAVLVEIGQYFNLAEILGIDDFVVARIIIGSTFDIKDIACYLIGSTIIYLIEKKKIEKIDG